MHLSVLSGGFRRIVRVIPMLSRKVEGTSPQYFRGRTEERRRGCSVCGGSHILVNARRSVTCQISQEFAVCEYWLGPRPVRITTLQIGPKPLLEPSLLLVTFDSCRAEEQRFVHARKSVEVALK